MVVYIPEDTSPRTRRDPFVAGVLVFAAIFLMALPPHHQERIATGIRATALRPFLVAQEALAASRLRGAEAERLRARTDSLVSLIAAQATLREENRRLRRLLDLTDRTGPRFRAAEVVRPGTPGSESMFLVDAGVRQGIREGAPVIAADGLVGVIRKASPAGAVGMDWSHPDFRASAMSENGEVYGIVEPRRGRFREEDRLVLTGAAFHADLHPGARIVTSGRGGVYPRGIPIGTVVALEEAEGGWRKSYALEAAVRPGSVTHVLVATAPALRETMLDLAGLWEPPSGGEATPAAAGDPRARGPGEPSAPPGGSGRTP